MCFSIWPSFAKIVVLRPRRKILSLDYLFIENTQIKDPIAVNNWKILAVQEVHGVINTKTTTATSPQSQDFLSKQLFFRSRPRNTFYDCLLQLSCSYLTFFLQLGNFFSFDAVKNIDCDLFRRKYVFSFKYCGSIVNSIVIFRSSKIFQLRTFFKGVIPIWFH